MWLNVCMTRGGLSEDHTQSFKNAKLRLKIFSTNAQIGAKFISFINFRVFGQETKFCLFRVMQRTQRVGHLWTAAPDL